MRLLEFSDIILLEGVRNSLDSLSVVISSRRIGKLNLDSNVIMKRTLLLDLSHNCFEEMEGMLRQFPEVWWFILRDNNLKKLLHNPPRFIGLLDVSENNITLNCLEPFQNSTILRLNITHNSKLSKTSRSDILSLLHEVWVLNDDFIKTEESLLFSDNNNSTQMYSGGWLAPQNLSHKEKELFDIMITHMPEKNQTSDYFKLDYLLDDYTYQAYIYNSADSTVLGKTKPMPIVNCNDILLMKHSDRIDLAVLLTSHLFYHVPEVVYKDTMEKLLVSYMSLKQIHDIIQLPTFVKTSLVCLIVRICQKELIELQQNTILPTKLNINNLLTGDNLFNLNSPPIRDNSGFRFLKSVRHFLYRDVLLSPPSGIDQPFDTFSELELDILDSLNEVPTKATFPDINSDAYKSWIPLVARHTLVMMTRVSSCPPLTKFQTSKLLQETYDELQELLTAAAMTYEDMNITFNGPQYDGRPNLKESKTVLSFGAGLPKSKPTSLVWNKNGPLRPYDKPWSGQVLELSPNALGDDNDLDLSIATPDDISETSFSKPNKKGTSSLIPSTTPGKHTKSDNDRRLSFDDDKSESDTSALSPSSVQQEGRPWSMSLQAHSRTHGVKQPEGMSHLLNSYSSCTDDDSELIPKQPSRPTTSSPSKAIVTGYSSDNNDWSDFLLAPTHKLDNLNTAGEKDWRQIGIAPLLVHPLSKYPVYIKKKSFQSNENSEDQKDVGYDVIPGEKKDWFLHVQEKHSFNSNLEEEDDGFAEYRHHLFTEQSRQIEDIELTNNIEIDKLQALEDYEKKIHDEWLTKFDSDMKDSTKKVDQEKAIELKIAIEYSNHKFYDNDSVKVNMDGLNPDHVLSNNFEFPLELNFKDALDIKTTEKAISNYLKSKDPQFWKSNLLKEMGTTRNIRFQRDTIKMMRRELNRQRKCEEVNKKYSYLGIRLDGDSLTTHDSQGTLDSIDHIIDKKYQVDLNRVTWNALLSKDNAGSPILQPITITKENDVEPDAFFLTETPHTFDVGSSRPVSPSKTKLSYIPKPISQTVEHVFQKQDTEKGWDPTVPLTKHVQKALKYSSVYTNSGEIDWGNMLTSGKTTSNWYPRAEKVTYTLGNMTPVDVARMQQRLMSPNKAIPTSIDISDHNRNPIKNKTDMNQLKSKDKDTPPLRASSSVSSLRKKEVQSRQRLPRPDKSRTKVTLTPKRVTALAPTLNFVNHSLKEREPIFVEVTLIDDAASRITADSIDNQSSNTSLKTVDLLSLYDVKKSNENNNNNKDKDKDKISQPEVVSDKLEIGSVGSLASDSIRCSLSGKSLVMQQLEQQQHENLSLCISKTWELSDRSSFAIPQLKVQPRHPHTSQKRNDKLPRILAQIDPIDADWVTNKGVITERQSGQTPLSVLRPITNSRPINSAFKIKKTKMLPSNLKSIQFTQFK